MSTLPAASQLPLFDEKRCTRCKRFQSINSFAPRPDRPSKRQAHCRPCETEYRREYAASHREQIRENYERFAAKHPERIQSWGKRYRAEHAEKHAAALEKCKREHKAQYAEYGRKYQLEHRDECNARAVQSYYRHQEKRIAASNAWSKAHPEKVAKSAIVARHRRRARKKGNGGTFTLWEWERIKARYDWTCLRCGRREPDIKLHADHVIPLVRGGFNIASNLAPLCPSCNAIKGKKIIDYRPDPYRI